ncbi:hypothetical protein DBV15_10893 [Temnothorax longispinosus]|uniref:Uncharacterized protein n=1 Tax=Temnothorax longispinosus TaxID=300112 RepID=A0A4S2LBX2_9HYME|nr:hypothetical protein DBV15_10893 [Temnothorax longispinosus]
MVGAAVLWCRHQPQRTPEASRNPAHGGHEGRAEGGEVVVARNRVRSYRRRGCHPTHRTRPPPRPPPPRRRHLEHHLEEGNHRWGSRRHACAPRARDVLCPPCLLAARRNTWGTHTELRSRARFRRWFTIRKPTGLAISCSSAMDLASRLEEKRIRPTVIEDDRHTGANKGLTGRHEEKRVRTSAGVEGSARSTRNGIVSSANQDRWSIMAPTGWLVGQPKSNLPTPRAPGVYRVV